ncbi:molybdate ABC transporter permease subunit [Ornithinibacillus halotolerans]|uniref:Molybdenum transport system permease n=1 Tax=Ornithinibacillus halotolerans TaxID=1274357 RepID=A0A916RMP1_9BACI|nr:molybdate ABC transporter permease subunit [Ornithinibacillus halotolerans]GGA61875.1 putative molybdenum transport system permease protein YvgM [Ornithinibacillus halotolerans]
MDSLLNNLLSEEFLHPIFLSIKVATISSIIVIVLGTLVGRFLSRKTFSGKSVVETLLMLPLVLPPTVVGFLLIVVFGRNSIVGRLFEWLFSQPIMFTTYAAIIASTVVAFPLMYQSAKSAFSGIDQDIEDAARVDGANERKVFLSISIPLASKMLISGCILSFARALGEFGATLMFAGNIPGVTQTVPTAIYIAMDSGKMTLAWLWVIAIMIISFIMLFMVRRKES